jgi:Ran GTPase-activating protein (RanGAP) involved in mRNA processing and transport
VLELGGNNIKDDGAIALAEILTYHPKWEQLFLVRNNISVTGSKALAKALMKNRSLKALSLLYNGKFLFSFHTRCHG